MGVNKVNKCAVFLQFEKYTFQDVIWPRLVNGPIKVAYVMGKTVSAIKFR